MLIKMISWMKTFFMHLHVNLMVVFTLAEIPSQKFTTQKISHPPKKKSQPKTAQPKKGKKKEKKKKKKKHNHKKKKKKYLRQPQQFKEHIMTGWQVLPLFWWRWSFV